MSLFLNALKGQNKERPPVWFMRQAGRYLPSYQEMKKKHSLLELFKTAHLAKEVTLLPFQDLDLDAAIIFSDILIIFESLGYEVDYPLGQPPLIHSPKTVREILESLEVLKVESSVGYLFDSIVQVKPHLKVPLLGFSATPFTLLSYLLEKPMKDSIMATKQSIYAEVQETTVLLEILTQQVIAYLKAQIKAGADALMLFDSASTSLSSSAFALWSEKYTQKVVDSLKAEGISIILFSKSSAARVDSYNRLKPDVLGVDWTASYADMRQRLDPEIGIQGNLDPYLSTLEFSYIEEELHQLLEQAYGDPNFIFNLGHGVLPETKLETLQKIIETVHHFQVAKSLV